MGALIKQTELLSRPVSVTGLYLAHSSFVRRVLRVHGVSHSCIEDGVQDVFLVALRRFSDFVPRASPRTWLFAISVRVAKDHRRRTRRKGGLLEFDERDVACSRFDPYAATLAAQTLERLEQRIGLLDEARRRVFLLAEVEEMSVPEIARALSVKLNTVYSRLRSARREFGVLPRRLPRGGVSAARTRLSLRKDGS